MCRTLCICTQNAFLPLRHLDEEALRIIPTMRGYHKILHAPCLGHTMFPLNQKACCSSLNVMVLQVSFRQCFSHAPLEESGCFWLKEERGSMKAHGQEKSLSSQGIGRVKDQPISAADGRQEHQAERRSRSVPCRKSFPHRICTIITLKCIIFFRERKIIRLFCDTLGAQTKRKRRQHLQIFATFRPYPGEIGTEETSPPLGACTSQGGFIAPLRCFLAGLAGNRGIVAPLALTVLCHSFL